MKNCNQSICQQLCFCLSSSTWPYLIRSTNAFQALDDNPLVCHRHTWPANIPCQFFLNTCNKHPMACPWGWDQGCLLLVYSVMYVLPLLLPHCMKCHLITDHVMMKLAFIKQKQVSWNCKIHIANTTLCRHRQRPVQTLARYLYGFICLVITRFALGHESQDFPYHKTSII